MPLATHWDGLMINLGEWNETPIQCLWHHHQLDAGQPPVYGARYTKLRIQIHVDFK